MVIRYRELTIVESDTRRLSDEELVLALIDAGASRLTAERIVAIEREGGEVGRARRHTRGTIPAR